MAGRQINWPSVDDALKIVDEAKAGGLPRLLVSDVLVVLSDEVKRLREMERQRWEVARGWFVSSAAATRSDLGLPPRVPLSNEDSF